VNPRQKILLTAGLLGAAAAVLCVRLGWGSPAWWALPAFVAAVTAAEFATVRMVIGRQGYSVALTDAFVAIGFVLAPGAWIPLGVLLAFLLANARRSPWIKLVFNLTQYPCAIAAGLLVTQTLGSGIPQAAVGLVVFACLNYLLVAIPIAITAHRPYAAVVAETSGLGMIHVAGNISLGLLAAWLAENAPLGLLGLVVPLVLLWWSYRQQTERTAEARLFAELARGREQIAATSVDTSAHVLLTAAARLFGGAEVEMLLRHPDGPVRYVGDEHGVIRRERVDSSAFAAPWVLRTMGARGVLTGVDADRPFCSAVLGDPGRPLAVLIARRPKRAGGFERLDARLAQVLVGQAEAWLSVADLAARHDVAIGQVEAYGDAARALGDLGAYTAPALVVLRESAERLSRLAFSFTGPDPVRDIVDELHAVERAVASLLGAVALTSEPELIGTADDHRAPTVGTDSEWTTTGRLDAVETR
jgi:hypothetical protein